MISRGIGETSLYRSLKLGSTSFDPRELAEGQRRFNKIAVLRYLYADNLVASSPFQSIFKGIHRIPAGAMQNGGKGDGLILGSGIDFHVSKPLSLDAFKLPDDGSSLLFSGGIDSSLLLACNPWVKSLFHINYHGNGSRTHEIAKAVAKKFKRNLVSIDPAIDDFNLENYEKILGFGLTGIQSPLQYCFNLELKRQVDKIGGGALLSGQNADTMLYVDHYHPPTQLILHERLSGVISGVSKRKRLWGNFNRGLLDSTKYGLAEHLDGSNKFQEAIIAKHGSAMMEEYNVMDFRGAKDLVLLKLIRWFRGCASVNDNFLILEMQTGLKRKAALNKQDFINAALSLKPAVSNYFLPKTELSIILKQVSGIHHRSVVLEAILMSSFRLAKSRAHRSHNLDEQSRFNRDVISHLFYRRRDSIKQLVSEIDDPVLSDHFAKLRSMSSAYPKKYEFMHKLVNLDIFVGKKCD